MKLLLTPSLLVFLGITLAPLASAGEAFFTPDGKTIITAVSTPSAITGLAKIDVASGKATKIPLPADFTEIESVARGAEGEILFLANDAVWVLKNGEAVRKVVSTTSVKHASDLFVGTKKGSPTEDWLFVSGAEDDKDTTRPTFFARKPGSKKFESVFCRRTEDALSGAFSADGRFFFASSADVWEGQISPDSEGSGGGVAVLVGARFAPLGYFNTDSANAGSMGVGTVCPAGKWIYCSMHGHHMGAIVRAPLLTKPLFAKDEGGFKSVKDNYTAMAQTLAKSEVIADDLEDIYGLCATEVNGKPLVFFYSRPDENGAPLMLWNGSGEPKVIGHLPRSKE